MKRVQKQHVEQTKQQVQQKALSIFSPRMQRMLLIILSIAVQFGIYVVLLVSFSQYFVYFYWLCLGVSLAVTLFISTRK